jgi:hypothetical protein
LELSSEDFENASDVYDAVGDLFLEISENGSDVIQDLCEQLLGVLKM